MVCKFLTALPGIKLILISRLKLISFYGLMIFAYSLSAILRTENALSVLPINVIIPFCVEFNKSNNSIS